MIAKRISLQPAFQSFLIVVFACILASSSSSAIAQFFCERFENLPTVPLSSQTSQTVFETPGTIIVIHGSGSAARATRSPDHQFKIEQSVTIPQYADCATV